MENAETHVWLDVALACEYISLATFNELDQKCEEVSRLLTYMIKTPEKFL